MNKQSSVATTGSPAEPATLGVPDLAVALLGRGGAAGLGGLPGLEAAFTRAGLGDRFASWVSVGPNLAVTPAELERALAPSLEAMAAATGADRARLAARLAELLPELVDRLTPAGRLPSGRLGTLWTLARLLLGRRVAA